MNLFIHWNLNSQTAREIFQKNVNKEATESFKKQVIFHSSFLSNDL